MEQDNTSARSSANKSDEKTQGVESQGLKPTATVQEGIEKGVEGIRAETYPVLLLQQHLIILREGSTKDDGRYTLERVDPFLPL